MEAGYYVSAVHTVCEWAEATFRGRDVTTMSKNARSPRRRASSSMSPMKKKMRSLAPIQEEAIWQVQGHASRKEEEGYHEWLTDEDSYYYINNF